MGDAFDNDCAVRHIGYLCHPASIDNLLRNS
jgi:hypothetical protein